MPSANSKKRLVLLLAILVFGCCVKNTSAQTSQSAFYVPLIGITSVPEPLALPKGPGDVTYRYAVKNFLQEFPLTGVRVTDDKCDPVKFVEGDDNHDARLDYGETWRYVCSTKLSTTTESTATAEGSANNIWASHKAYATVVVGSNNPPPLVSIVNITKVAYPLSLPAEGGNITFTYKVNNPGVAPLSDVSVSDDKCKAMSGKLGDTNGNNLLDASEVWIYTCAMNLRQTTTNTVTVRASANGLMATDSYTITVKVLNPNFPDVGMNPDLPNVGTNPDLGGNTDLKIIVWGVLFVVLMTLIIVFVLTPKSKKQ